MPKKDEDPRQSKQKSPPKTISGAFKARRCLKSFFRMRNGLKKWPQNTKIVLGNSIFLWRAKQAFAGRHCRQTYSTNKQPEYVSLFRGHVCLLNNTLGVLVMDLNTDPTLLIIFMSILLWGGGFVTLSSAKRTCFSCPHQEMHQTSNSNKNPSILLSN